MSTGRGRPIARWLLGLLLVAMAAGQLSDPGGFVDIVDDYRIGGTLPAALVASALVLGELIGGLGLLAGREARRSSAPTVAVVVALAWSALAVQAFARGLVLESCGCFGVHLAQPLRWWVLLEDAELVALALWVRRQNRSATGPLAASPEQLASR